MECFDNLTDHVDTSRQPRAGEEDGVQYHFIPREDFLAKKATGNFFIETAEFGSNMYGTSFDAVRAISAAGTGRTCILDIELEGVKQVKKASDLAGRFLFVAPPDMATLESRLRSRGTESEDQIQKRLAQAKVEMEASTTPGLHDKIIVNDDLDSAYTQLKQFCLETSSTA